MPRVIRRLLRRGVSTVNDATNLIESQREFHLSLADQCDARLLVVRVAASGLSSGSGSLRQVALSAIGRMRTGAFYLRMQQRRTRSRPFVTVKMDGELSEPIGKVLRDCAATTPLTQQPCVAIPRMVIAQVLLRCR
jgi:hypothetical protein